MTQSQLMTEKQETQTTSVVRQAYAAFQRGDIPGVLALVDDDVRWQAVYGAGTHVPTSGAREGKAAVAEFFKQVGANVDFSRFEPQSYIATGDTVVALGHYTASTPAGRGFDSDFAMVFTIHNGKIVTFQEFCDSAAIDAAYT